MVARTDRPRVVCPFLGTSRDGEEEICLAQPDNPTVIARSYVDLYCHRARHITCRRFIGADPEAKRAVSSHRPVGRGTAPTTRRPQQPPAAPDEAVQAGTLAITDPEDGSRVPGDSLTVSGTGQPGAGVTLFDRQTRVAQTTVDSDGQWTIELASVRPGMHRYIARIGEGGRYAAQSEPCQVAVARPSSAAPAREHGVPPEEAPPPALPPVEAKAPAAPPPVTPTMHSSPPVIDSPPPVTPARDSAPPAETAEPGPAMAPPAVNRAAPPPPTAPVTAAQAPSPANVGVSRPAPPTPETAPPRIEKRGPRWPWILAGAVVVVVLLWGTAITGLLTLRHRSSSGLPAVRAHATQTAPVPTAVKQPTHAPVAAATRVSARVVPTANPAASGLSTWHFAALPSAPGHVVVALYNPQTSALTTEVRIIQGGHVDQRSVQIPARQTARIETSWLTNAALTVQADSSVVPTRVQVG